MPAARRRPTAAASCWRSTPTASSTSGPSAAAPRRAGPRAGAAASCRGRRSRRRSRRRPFRELDAHRRGLRRRRSLRGRRGGARHRLGVGGARAVRRPRAHERQGARWRASTRRRRDRRRGAARPPARAAARRRGSRSPSPDRGLDGHQRRLALPLHDGTPLPRDTDPAFAGPITFRPNEAAEQFVPDTAAGRRLAAVRAAAGGGRDQAPAEAPPSREQLPALITKVPSRSCKRLTLSLSFKRHAQGAGAADRAAQGQDGGQDARTARFKPGRHTLKLPARRASAGRPRLALRDQGADDRRGRSSRSRLGRHRRTRRQLAPAAADVRRAWWSSAAAAARRGGRGVVLVVRRARRSTTPR